MKAFPHAKINLSLYITGRRADGYHSIDTLFLPVTLYDCLSIRPSKENRIACDPKSLETADNLVCRAVAAMQDSYGAGPISADLKKAIPLQAGLGGGSADGAVALRLTDRLYNLKTDSEALSALGAVLGADLPALMAPGPSRGRSRGDVLSPIPAGKRLFFLILVPDVACSTALMYRAWDEKGEAPLAQDEIDVRQTLLSDALIKGDWAGVAALLHNDFESLLPDKAGRACEKARALLRDKGAAAACLSGSGSAVFGLFSDEALRDKAWEALRPSLPAGWSLFACESWQEGEPKCSVILAAGGSGSRFGGPGNKIFAPLKGKPILWHSLKPFITHPAVREILIAHRPQEAGKIRQVLTMLEADLGPEHPPVTLTPGGTDRRASVYQALKACRFDRLLIHDAARPFVREEAIDDCLLALAAYPAVTQAVPSRDTVKIANEKGEVVQTTERSRTWLIQTPQAFRRRLLLEAHETVKEAVTDDCSLMEKAGYTVKLIPGDPGNIKVTLPGDLPV